MMPLLSWLEDPTVFRINRLNAHSDHTIYVTPEEMEANATSLRQSLDGQWRFCYSKRPADRPEDFWKMGYDDSHFGTIQVPGHWQTQGYDQIQYINKLYDWDGHSELRPPHVDWDDNPVGSYVTTFDLDAGLIGKPVCISFGGAETALYVWLNGSFVGYSEDSFTPSEFDLTPYIREKGNRLCVEVYKRCSGSWLEDQDFFSFSGLFRSVYLYAKLPVFVEDVWFKTSVDPDCKTGRLTVRLLAQGADRPKVHFHMTHPEDGVLFSGALMWEEKDGYLYSQELVFSNIRLWDHGTAELYYGLLTVEDGGFIPYDIGFRRFGIENKVMMLNGKRLVLNGVNRHEWNPDTGRCITMKDMEAAIETFHANNINAVRTCHYPNRSEWYFLCDREGIYMMDETNLETHGSWQKDAIGVEPSWNIPGSLPEWKENVLDRANSMFQRDKNHVSILFWSCGNEAFAGLDIVAMSDFFHAQDSSRVVHYEGVYWCREFDYLSDVETRMYETPPKIREYLENDPQKPFLNCEYMHNMGNSLGGMESYVKLGEEFPMYQGGFIWDFMDQAMWQTNALGQRSLGYGGDFGERQCDYAFSGNGIVTADGIPKPCMQEVRYWHMSPEKRAAFDDANAEAEAQVREVEVSTKSQPLHLVDGDGAYGVRGEGFEVLFSKLHGGPDSIVHDGKEWLWRAPRLAFWRAPTENDCGCGFPERSAVWSAVDSWQKCSGFQVLSYTDAEFAIRYDFTSDVMPDLEASIIYRLDKDGTMQVTASYTGKAGRPQLPVFGVRFATPAPVDQTTWVGLSGETYPDRWKGGIFGTHSEVPGIANYLVPQECGGHFHTHSTVLTMDNASLTMEKGEKPYFFSAIPYTPGQLEQAFHSYELPAPVRTVVTVCSAMRGVGGIDTWGNDVEAQYHVHSEENHCLSFKLHL